MQRFVYATLLVAAVVGGLSEARDIPQEGLRREKRQDLSWNNVVGVASCSPKVITAARKCEKELDDKVKGRENEQTEQMQCCKFAEYRRCVEW